MSSSTISPIQNISIKDLGNDNQLFLIDFESLSQDLIDSMDKQLVKICEGNSGSNLQYVKKRIISFLTTKKGSDIELGAIAEYMLHHHLNILGFEPKFLYFNLEENSMKKGFDGYYLLNGERWILESKSGSISTKNISHPSKVQESYTDLRDKLAGKAKNNPWNNALSHASNYWVGVELDLVSDIRTLAQRYDLKDFEDIKDYNIIPGSTIFLDGLWQKLDHDQIEIEIRNLIANLNFKKIKIICLNKKSIDLFWDYLKI